MSDEAAFELEQREILEALLGRQLTPREVEGFRIVYPRFIDRFGDSRLGELRRIFCTELPQGKRSLATSLVRVADALGSYDHFEANYPVSVIPPLPAYPLFPIADLASFRPHVYRVLSSGNREALEHIRSTGRLPQIPRPEEPVLRETPRGHWCAYETWATPAETRRALQIRPAWSDCAARATLDARNLLDLAYVAYSLDPDDPDTRGLAFHGYFYEGVTQDHDEAAAEGRPGDAVQICVFGEPPVELLEVWDAAIEQWQMTWVRPPD